MQGCMGTPAPVSTYSPPFRAGIQEWVVVNELISFDNKGSDSGLPPTRESVTSILQYQHEGRKNSIFGRMTFWWHEFFFSK